MEPGRAARQNVEGPVVLFDGLCNLCNGMIQFVVDHERSPSLTFAPLQSELAKELLERAFGADKTRQLIGGATGEGDPDSIVLVDGIEGWTHSSAALRVARHLRAPYRWLAVLLLVPRPLRDMVYRWIGRNRYRWFGKSETCRVPTPELRARFLA
jgi:predicted DCC family thiol-disulfide oxidoreductase YuxK